MRQVEQCSDGWCNICLWAGVTRTFPYAFFRYYTFSLYRLLGFHLGCMLEGAWGAGGGAVKMKGEDTYLYVVSP